VIAPNVPNILTVMRILLVPVVVVALLEETRHGDILAAFVFAVASVTDWVDGWLARQHGNVTNFGKLMDPIADKLLVTAALVALVALDQLAAWVAMVIIAREIAVTASRMAASNQGVVIAAKRWGKIKTSVQVLTIFLVILVQGSPTWLDALVYVTVGVTIISGVDYFFGMRRSLGERTRAQSA